MQPVNCPYSLYADNGMLMATGNKTSIIEGVRQTTHETEQRRRNQWNFDYDFGASADAEEQQAEKQRRAQYDADTLQREQVISSTLAQGNNIPIIPSVPTSHSRPARHPDPPPRRVLPALGRPQYDTGARRRQQGTLSSSGQATAGLNIHDALTPQSRRLTKPQPTLRKPLSG